ncbi:MAG TPA: hypothetical protein EYQ21_04980 [Flavobacteriales bacterium]|nr:hypothetical protein [Flavobacteriales bacterium]
MEKILENLWVLFIAIGSWMVTRLTAKIDTLEKDKADNSSVNRNSGLIHETDKRLDEIQHTTVPRNEYKSDVAGLHERINFLERSKEDKVQDIRIVDSNEKKKGK